MVIDLDHYLRLLEPWDCRVRLGGQQYRVRPLTLGDLAVMEQMRADGGAAADLKVMVDVARSLFDGTPLPDLSGWDADALSILLAEVGDYLAERSKKNAPKIKAAMEASRAGRASGE